MAQYSQRVTASADDGYFAAEWFNNSSANNVGYFSADVYSAWRFLNVAIAQGTTITSAYLKLTAYDTDSDSINRKIRGFDEDNTATFSSDPGGRSKTTAGIDWDISGQTGETVYTSPDIKTVIQEIIDRAGWSSGNAIGLISNDDSGANFNALQHYAYDGSSTKCALLEINWSGASPSASVSPSSSVSPSTSASISPSTSISPSSSPSPSPGPEPNQAVLKISKPGVNVLTNSDIEKFIFTSEAGTLKYFTKQEINISFDASTDDITAYGEYAHNLGYYPYVEVYVSVYIGSATGVYEYCPFYGSGASVLYNANVKVTTDKVTVYGEISGVSSSVWHFDFLVFVYKNDLAL